MPMLKKRVKEEESHEQSKGSITIELELMISNKRHSVAELQNDA